MSGESSGLSRATGRVPSRVQPSAFSGQLSARRQSARPKFVRCQVIGRRPPIGDSPKTFNIRICNLQPSFSARPPLPRTLHPRAAPPFAPHHMGYDETDGKIIEGATMDILESLRLGASPEQFAAQIYREDPPGVRAFRLRKWVVDQESPTPAQVVPYMLACVAEADRISDAMVARNERARQAEEADDLATAVKQYERNVNDWFDGNLPYERLRIIYNREKRYADALRVCQAFISMASRLLALGSPREDLERKREHFSDWVGKLADMKDQ